MQLESGEKITSVIEIDKFGEDEYLAMVTKFGVIKRTRLSEYAYQRKGGKIAISLDDGDELLYVRRTMGESDLLIATRNGLSVRFGEYSARCMGRLARGVRAITLEKGDEVVGVSLVDDNKKLLTITENGFGKKCLFSDFRSMKNRGGKGVVCQNISDKTGKLASIAAVEDNDDIMIITNEGTIIRTPVSDIPVYSRTAGGVIVMRLDDGASIVNFERLKPENEIDEEAKKTEESVASEPAEKAEGIGMSEEEHEENKEHEENEDIRDAETEDISEE